MGTVESAIQEVSDIISSWNSEDAAANAEIISSFPQEFIDYAILSNIQPSTQELPWPVDFQGDLMLFLDLQSLGRSLQVCRSWYLCIRKDEYWKRGILPLIGQLRMTNAQWQLYADVLGWVRTGWAHAVLSAVYCGRVGRISGVPRVPYLRNDDEFDGIMRGIQESRSPARFLHPKIFTMHAESSWFHRWVLTRGRSHPLIITIQPNRTVVKLGQFLRFRILIENVSHEEVRIFNGRDGSRYDICPQCRWRETPLLVGFQIADADWPQPLGIVLPCSCSNLKKADDPSTPADPVNTDGKLPITPRITIDAGQTVELFATFEFSTAPKYDLRTAHGGMQDMCGLRSRKHFMPLVKPGGTRTMVAFGNAIRARANLGEMQWDDLTLSAPVEIAFDAST